MVSASGLLRMLRITRTDLREDFRGSRWGATSAQVLDNEVENLREGWCGASELFGLPVSFRYTFGPAGLRGGAYEFLLSDVNVDAAMAFRRILAALMRQYQMPLYLQQTPAVLFANAQLPPMSLLRSMAQGSSRCIAAWATQRSEVLLIKDDTAVPLRLLCHARDESLYPDAPARSPQTSPRAEELPVTNSIDRSDSSP